MMFVGLSQVRRSSSSALAALAALGLTLGACTGDDMGSTETDPTTDSMTNPTTTDPTTSASETDGTTTDDSDSDTSSTTDPTTTAGVVDYEGDIQPIWDKSCVAGCHTPGGSQSGIPLDPGDSHGALVGKASLQAAGMDIVTPEDTANSYLWHKLNNTHTSGDVGGSGLSMPFGSMLGDAELGLIEDWINSGAES